MRLDRTFAALVLTASLAGGALAQDRIARDDETIFLAATVEDIATAGRLAASVPGVTGVANQIRVADRAWRA